MNHADKERRRQETLARIAATKLGLSVDRLLKLPKATIERFLREKRKNGKLPDLLNLP